MNKVLQGCVLDMLPAIPAESCRTCVTSPPYWGLRDYGVDGQMGLEETPEQWVEQMVAVFREVRRVLTPDGTLWLNMGDAYASNGVGQGSVFDNGRTDGRKSYESDGVRGRKGVPYRIPHGLKSKDLVGQPWLLAFALRADGWYLRADIIWHKPNPMPESVTDRPTKAHEYLFLLSKQAKYYYDADAIREDGPSYTRRAGGYTRHHEQGASRFEGKGGFGDSDVTTHGRNKRSVWTVNSHPFPDAHFATFPPKLIEPCILAGSEVGDIVLDPFMGSGTTAQVAQNLGRQWVGCELNPEYVRLIEQRTAQQAMAL